MGSLTQSGTSATTAGYPSATVQPTRVPVPPQPPLPVLFDPASPPLVPAHPAAHDEPLVPVAGHHAAIIDLATYADAGWQGAPTRSIARAGALDRLAIAADALPDGFGFAVFDAWRPLALQHRIFDHFYGPGSTLEPGFVSVPSDDPATPPPHLTGGTFDLTLTWLGEPLALGTAFDEFDSRAHTAAIEDEPGVERELRRLLLHSLTAVGFVAMPAEWWHVEYGTRRWAAHHRQAPVYGAA
jgi:D-alanyl-D-alanine dipeptidase